MAIAGAALGGHNALQALLVRAFEEKQAQERQQLAQQELSQRAQRDQGMLDLQNRELAANTDYRTGQQERQGRLDAEAATERGLKRSAENNQAGMRRMIGDFLTQRGSQPLDAGSRQQMAGMAVSEGVDLPNALLTDPDLAHKQRLELEGVDHKNRLVEIAAQRRPLPSPTPTEDPGMRALAEMAARSGSVPEGTPTQRGAVLKQMASDPRLRVQYETKRMEPIRAQATTMLSALDDLIDKEGELTPGGRGVFGEYTPVFARGLSVDPGTVAANASLGQVIGQSVVDLIREMKGQSSTGATGFGQLNRAELDIILASATRLTQRLPEDEAKQELNTLREKFAKIMQPSMEEAAASVTTNPYAPGVGNAVVGANSLDPLLDELLGGGSATGR